MRSIKLCALALALSASGAALAASGKPAAAAEPAAKPKSAGEYVTRDWAKMDKNKDHIISPEEMIAYIEANPGPLARQKQSAKAGEPRAAATLPEPAVTVR